MTARTTPGSNGHTWLSHWVHSSSLNLLFTFQTSCRSSAAIACILEGHGSSHRRSGWICNMRWLHQVFQQKEALPVGLTTKRM